MKLKVSVLSDRQDETQVERQSPFGSSVRLTLRRIAPIERPVSLARTLKNFGLRLSEAHKALNRIVADETVALQLDGAPRAIMIAELAALGVSAE